MSETESAAKNGMVMELTFRGITLDDLVFIEELIKLFNKHGYTRIGLETAYAEIQEGLVQ